MLCNSLRRLSILAPLTLVVIALLSFVLPMPVEAQGIAISGSFYRHHFQLLPGESLSTPDIYVMVFNHYDKDIRVKLTPQTPPGIEILLAESEFSIPAGGQRKVELGVSISPKAVPGEYVIAISADVHPEGGEGIVITGAAEQQAKLSIFGEAGEVHISTITPDGEPFRAELHLYQKLEGQLSPCGYSDTGELETRLVPGDYMVQAFFQETEVAREEFSLRADEKKDITLVAQTVFILGFSVAPNYFEDSGKIAFANIVYTIKNIYQPLKNVTTTLKVALNNELLEEAEIISTPMLNVGSTAGSYKYTPPQGWQSGTYTFRMELYSQDKLYAQSPEKELKVSVPVPLARINWRLVGAIIGGLLIIVGIILAIRRRRKKEKGLLEGTIYFERFEVSPIYSKETGALALAKVSYAISNRYKAIPEARVELQVRKDNVPFEHIALVTLSPLERGRVSLSYNYVPEEGWQKGVAYGVKLALYVAEKLYTITAEKKLKE